MRYDLVDLRLFLHIGETLNLTRAAEKSFLSLPAASARIKQLEDAFQAPLMIRQPKGVQLTPAGEALLAHARELLRSLERMHSDLLPYAKGIKGRIRLLANTTATNSFLPEALARFLGDNPDIDVELEEHLSQEIVALIASGAADLGIVAGDVPLAGLEATPLFTDELVLIAPKEHPLGSLKSVSFADMVDQVRFVGLNQSSAIQSFLEQAARRAGKRISLRIQLGSFDAVCRMVAAGVGVAVIPRTCAERFADALGLALVPLEDAWARREIRLVRRAHRDLPQFGELLIRYLVDATS
jgi:DNA-binding transcriptional LysR family regulator